MIDARQLQEMRTHLLPLGPAVVMMGEGTGPLLDALGVICGTMGDGHDPEVARVGEAVLELRGGLLAAAQGVAAIDKALGALLDAIERGAKPVKRRVKRRGRTKRG